MPAVPAGTMFAIAVLCALVAPRVAVDPHVLATILLLALPFLRVRLG